jgi:deoxyribodipyrimidine photolyase
MPTRAVVWFRRDLRVADHPALLAALDARRRDTAVEQVLRADGRALHALPGSYLSDFDEIRNTAGDARKFAISLPEELFERLEQVRQEQGMNRSEYVANAVADHLHRKREQELEEQYVRGYLEHPETEEELAELEAWLSIGPELEPWE